MKYITYVLAILLVFTGCKQTPKLDEILSLEDETDIILGIGELLWEKSKNDKNFESLNQFEKNVLYIEMLEGQVNNGGFDQYFFNSSGEYAHETLVALNDIGANNTVDIFEQAIKIFPKFPIPKDMEERREYMRNLPKNISEVWYQLEDKFYEYPDAIGQLTIKYIKKNRAQFE